MTSPTRETIDRHSQSVAPAVIPEGRAYAPIFRIGIVTLLFTLLAAAVGERVLETPFWSFNGTRLLPTFFLVRGIPVFSGPHMGSLQSTLYGPVTLLIYLPTVLMRTPNAAVLLGSVITVLLCFGMALWMHIAASAGQHRLAILPFLATGFMILYLSPLLYSCIRVHADAPAIFFGALAIVVLVRQQKVTVSSLVASAICAVLSVWAKQPFVGVPAGLCIFVAVTQGSRRLLQYFLFLVLAASAISAIFAAAFGLHALYFNLLWLPAHQPWTAPSRPMAAFSSFRWLLTIGFSVFAGLAAAIIYLVGHAKFSPARVRSFTTGKIWFASLLVGICLLPLSVIGAAKQGGDVNSFSFCLFFLLLALMLLLQEATVSVAPYPLSQIARAAILALMLVAMVFTVPFIALIPARLKSLPNSDQEVAFRYDRAHPGEAYFPWFPLVHLMAEDRDYNSPYGLWDHVYAGITVSPQEFRKHMPAAPEAIAFNNDGRGKDGGFVHQLNLMSYLPQFRCVSHNPELPGFILVTKMPSAGACELYLESKPSRSTPDP